MYTHSIWQNQDVCNVSVCVSDVCMMVRWLVGMIDGVELGAGGG